MTKLAAPQPCMHTKAQISALAEECAKQYRFLPGDRIEPVVSRMGGRITYLNGLDSIEAVDGSLLVHGPDDFDIYVSAFTGPERDRFTIAHELGHYVLHGKQGKTPIRATRFGSSRVEWEANWFAAAFLMPKKEFRRTCERHQNDLESIAAHFLVSPKAAEIRMTTLGLGIKR